MADYAAVLIVARMSRDPLEKASMVCYRVISVGRKEDKAQTRARIMREARRLFAARPVAQIKIEEIAEAASVAPGTLYVHFGGKGDLADALMESINQDLTEQIAQTLFKHADGAAHEIIVAIASTYLRFWRRNIDAVSIYVDVVSRKGSMQLFQAGTNPKLTGSVTKLAVMAGSDAEDAKVATGMVLAIWRQMGFHAALEKEIELDKLARTLANTTEAVFETLVPGLLDLSPKKAVEVLLIAKLT